MKQQQLKTEKALFVRTTTQGNHFSKTIHTNQLTNNLTIMKKNIFLIALFFMAIAAQAQDTKRNALKINPLSLLAVTGNVSYERALSNSHSIQIGGFYSGAGIDNFKYQGYGIIPEVRFYFGKQKQALNGGYVAPFGRYQNFSITNKSLLNKADFTTIGGGAVVGYQRAWESGFVLNIFAGPSFSKLTFENNNKIIDDFDIQKGMDGFGLRSGLTIGFTF